MYPMTMLLDYLYNKFAVTFILSIIGVSIRVMVGNVNNRHRISIIKIVASTLFSTILMCAIGEYVEFIFSVYVLACVLMGMWSTKIISLASSSKFMGKVAKKLIKNIATPVTKTLADVLEDEEKEKQTKKKDNDTNATDGDNPKKENTE